jgi:hypothetical protein
VEPPLQGKTRACCRCNTVFDGSDDEWRAREHIRETVINPEDPNRVWMWLHLDPDDPGLPPDQRGFVSVVNEAVLQSSQVEVQGAPE